MSMNSQLAVVGMDAHIRSLDNIDKVERAFYTGQFISFNRSDLVKREFCLDEMIEKLAKYTHVELSDLYIIALSEQSDLNQALELAAKACAQQKIVALVAQHDELLTDDGDYKATFSLDSQFRGYATNSGAICILLADPVFALSQNMYIYSHILAFNENQNIEIAVSQALKSAQLDVNDIGVLEFSALSDSGLLYQEKNGLCKTYRGIQHNTAISSARSVIGEAGDLSVLAGLLKVIIAVQQRYIPGTSDWLGVSENQLEHWARTSFYFPVKSQPWYPKYDSDNKLIARKAAYSCQTRSSYCHIIVAENILDTDGKIPEQEVIRYNGFFSSSPLKLVLVSEDNLSALLNKLSGINTHEYSSIEYLAKQYYGVFDANQTYCIALLAESFDELNKEIALAITNIPDAVNAGQDWKTPRGSYFSPIPVNHDNNVAFIYPGIGATYIGLGKDLFHLFPQIYPKMASLTDNIASTLKDTLLYPRSINRPSFELLKAKELRLRQSLSDIAEAGVGFACIFTYIFENVFKVKADYSAGYSMGEVSMYAALGCWQQPEALSEKLANSLTFNQKLSGELSAAKSLWQLSDANDKNEIWETYSIRATIEQVQLASTEQSKVYCTIINTPDNLLLAGYPPECRQVIKNLGVRAMPINMANAIHCEVAQSEYENMVMLYTMKVTERIKTKMYSSSCYLPIPHRTVAIAHSIAKCLCEQVDFPRLIKVLNSDGAQVFVEMGPGRSLSGWVDKILHNSKSSSHISVAVNAKGTQDEVSYLRAIAQLVSHGINIDLQNSFSGSILVKNKKLPLGSI